MPGTGGCSRSVAGGVVGEGGDGLVNVRGLPVDARQVLLRKIHLARRDRQALLGVLLVGDLEADRRPARRAVLHAHDGVAGHLRERNADHGQPALARGQHQHAPLLEGHHRAACRPARQMGMNATPPGTNSACGSGTGLPASAARSAACQHAAQEQHRTAAAPAARRHCRRLHSGIPASLRLTSCRSRGRSRLPRARRASISSPARDRGGIAQHACRRHA